MNSSMCSSLPLRYSLSPSCTMSNTNIVADMPAWSRRILGPNTYLMMSDSKVTSEFTNIIAFSLKDQWRYILSIPILLSRVRSGCLGPLQHALFQHLGVGAYGHRRPPDVVSEERRLPVLRGLDDPWQDDVLDRLPVGCLVEAKRVSRVRRVRQREGHHIQRRSGSSFRMGPDEYFLRRQKAAFGQKTVLI